MHPAGRVVARLSAVDDGDAAPRPRQHQRATQPCRPATDDDDVVLVLPVLCHVIPPATQRRRWQQERQRSCGNGKRRSGRVEVSAFAVVVEDGKDLRGPADADDDVRRHRAERRGLAGGDDVLTAAQDKPDVPSRT